MSDAEFYQQSKEEERERKMAAHIASMKVINELSALFDIPVELIKEWHIRIWFPTGRFDYYTQSGKSTWVGTNQWGVIKDLEKFIRDQYPDHPENKKL